MAQTPEGKVKDAVKAVLHEFDILPAAKAALVDGHRGWYYMPSQNGMGVKGIPDFVGHYKGEFFSIETKAPGKQPTGFQAMQIQAILDTGGMAVVVDGEEGVKWLRTWLRLVRK